jgi:hypothetical protein
MKPLIMTMALVVAGCAAPGPFAQSDVKQVQVLGRTWTVTEVPQRTNAFVAQRDNNNLQPFGKPVALMTPQAVRALETATGCKVVAGKLWQDVSARFHAEMACPG